MTDSLRLWQLISPTLPVGAYSYSHGLEYAVNADWVDDSETALNWIDGVALSVIARLELPVAARIYNAWIAEDLEAVRRWNRFVMASRESAELRAEDRQLGDAMLKVLPALGVDRLENVWEAGEPLSHVCVFACACATWRIGRGQMARAYLWTWVENQVAAAVKLVPLGHTAGQRILSQILKRIPEAVDIGLALEDFSIGACAPGLAIASARHENQYTRLFRS
jgi:urease accessory protein